MKLKDKFMWKSLLIKNILIHGSRIYRKLIRFMIHKNRLRSFQIK